MSYDISQVCPSLLLVGLCLADGGSHFSLGHGAVTSGHGLGVTSGHGLGVTATGRRTRHWLQRPQRIFWLQRPHRIFWLQRPQRIFWLQRSQHIFWLQRSQRIVSLQRS